MATTAKPRPYSPAFSASVLAYSANVGNSIDAITVAATAADAYARRTADAAAFISALKRLSVDNLSNLTPHPFKVLLAYSHPPILQRLQALRRGGSI